MESQENLKKYLNDDVVKYYDKLEGLSPAEVYLFDKYIEQNERILDLGVGGGRTTPYLSSKASKYIGVDYAKTMVELCQSKFTGLEFQEADASRLENFSDDSFDKVVFSFNGIDAIESDEARLSCLAEIKRVLKPGGQFIFSVHNAKSMLVYPQLSNTDFIRKVWRVVRALFVSVRMTLRRLFQKAFWKGEGFIQDPVHGGMRHHVASRECVIKELTGQGYVLVEVIPGNYPAKPVDIAVPWFYFCFTAGNMSK